MRSRVEIAPVRWQFDRSISVSSGASFQLAIRVLEAGSLFAFRSSPIRP